MKIINFLSFSKKETAACNPEELRAGVEDVYSAAARKPAGKYSFPVGREFAESIGYPVDTLDAIPAAAWEAFVGVSNVSVFADITLGETILDLGCGAGLDSIIARQRTGGSGKVIGIDFSKDMLKRAKQAVEEIGIDGQVEFHCASAEELPLQDSSIDTILVNGIFNLNPKRNQIFTELSRVLKGGGKVYAAEMVFTEHIEIEKISKLDDWFA